MWTRGRVIERIDWSDKLFSLRIAAELAPFIPGQFIKLSQVQDDKRVARAYSLVIPPINPMLNLGCRRRRRAVIPAITKSCHRG